MNYFSIGVLVALLLGSSGLAMSQPPATQWIEGCSSLVDDTESTKSGTSAGTPEPLTHSITVTPVSFTLDLTFPPSILGPAAQVNASGSSGGWSGGIGGATSSMTATINFWFEVVEISPPPVAVTEVLVHIQASGEVSSTGPFACYGQATSTFQIGPQLSPDVFETAFADFTIPAASFSVNTIERFAPAEIVEGRMFADAGMRANGATSGSGTASAYIDPVIEVLDTTIPGTSVSYRDHYRIEFGAGFDALEPTPVRTETWSGLKQRYGN